jgi:hypothetical protein
MPPEKLLQYGFSVIPCKQGTGTEEDKKPRIGWKRYQKELPSADQVRRWEQSWPRSNWAIVTGAVSGIVVLDIDSEEGEHEAQKRGLPATVSVSTSKGRHLYFRHPGQQVGIWAKKIPGCDFRGDGGYVMAPGSIHPSGVIYQWIDSIEDVELADMPAWLLEACLSAEKGSSIVYPATTTNGHTNGHSAAGNSRYVQRAFEAEIDVLSNTAHGSRNAQLFKTTARLYEFVAAGALSDAEVDAAIWGAVRAFDRYPDHPVNQGNVRNTIANGRQAGLKHPAVIPISDQPYQVSSTTDPTTVPATVIAVSAPEEGQANEPQAEEQPDPWKGVFIPDWDNEPPALPPVVLMNEKGLGSVGNITAIVAAPSSGKSAVCEALMAARINPNVDSFSLEVRTTGAAVYLDTERSRADHYASWRRMLRRAGLVRGEVVPDCVRFMSLKMIGQLKERQRLLQLAIDEHAPGLLILDGIADFVRDVNDSGECNDFMQYLGAMAEERSFAVLVTIHHNPSVTNLKARGHLGSEILRRAEGVLYLIKDPDTGQRTLTTNIQHGKARNADEQNEAYFSWSDESKMFLSVENSVPTLSPQASRKLLELFEKLYADKMAYDYSSLLEAVMAITQTTESNAKKKMTAMRRHGLVTVDRAGLWIRNELQINENPF